MNRRQGVWLAVLLALMLAGCETQPVPKKITPAKSGERSTVVGGVLDRTDQSVCEQYLGQLNQAVQLYKVDHDGQNPPNLETVIKQSGLPASELQNCTYQYNPQTGQVSLAK
jgi:hypothetical protein